MSGLRGVATARGRAGSVIIKDPTALEAKLRKIVPRDLCAYPPAPAPATAGQTRSRRPACVTLVCGGGSARVWVQQPPTTVP